MKHLIIQIPKNYIFVCRICPIIQWQSIFWNQECNLFHTNYSITRSIISHMRAGDKGYIQYLSLVRCTHSSCSRVTWPAGRCTIVQHHKIQRPEQILTKRKHFVLYFTAKQYWFLMSHKKTPNQNT